MARLQLRAPLELLAPDLEALGVVVISVAWGPAPPLTKFQHESQFKPPFIVHVREASAINLLCKS